VIFCGHFPDAAEKFEFPHLRALAPALASYDGAAELDRGLDLLLTANRTHPDGSPRST
jgi:hypothetical protein